VQQLCVLVELLRTVRQPVQQHGAAVDRLAVMVEARQRARIDGGIGRVLRDARFDLGARVVEGQTSSSRRMRE
jgi:hypothetical protein